MTSLPGREGAEPTRSEVLRGILAGLTAGALTGVVIGLMFVAWQVSYAETTRDAVLGVARLLVVGSFTGGALGLAAGWAAGILLRLVRPFPATAAGVVAGLGSGGVVLAGLTVLTPMPSSRPDPTAWVLAAVAAIAASAATPWIRRTED